MKFPSGKQLTTLIRLCISQSSHSITLLVQMRVQCSNEKSACVNVSSMPSSTFWAASFSFIFRRAWMTCLDFSHAAVLFSWVWMALRILAIASFCCEVWPKTYRGRSGLCNVGILLVEIPLRLLPEAQRICHPHSAGLRHSSM